MKQLALSGPVILFLSVSFLVSTVAAAQQPIRGNAANTGKAPDRSIIDAAGYRSSDSIEEKLVRLALEGPQLKAANGQNKINEYILRGAKNSWMNLLTLSLNYNDQTFAKPAGTTGTATYIYPKYFFGLNIPLGTVFSRTQVRAAQEQVKIGTENQQQLARNVRADVLEKYRLYKTKKELLKLQIQVVDDEQASFLQIEKAYRDGSVPLEAHNAAQKKYNDELVKKLTLQLELDSAKFELEKLIGTNLESVTN
jgi:outer membrane protein TolC